MGSCTADHWDAITSHVRLTLSVHTLYATLNNTLTGWVITIIYSFVLILSLMLRYTMIIVAGLLSNLFCQVPTFVP